MKLKETCKYQRLISLLFLILSINSFVEATEYLLPSGDKRLIGQLEHHVVQKGDYFQEIAEKEPVYKTHLVP